MRLNLSMDIYQPPINMFALISTFDVTYPSYSIAKMRCPAVVAERVFYHMVSVDSIMFVTKRLRAVTAVTVTGAVTLQSMWAVPSGLHLLITATDITSLFSKRTPKRLRH
jgi:hypothetical protein